MTNLFKIGFLSTFLLAIYYLGALFCYLPNDSVMHSKSAMEGACCFYLLGQLFISVAFFLLVIIDKPQNLIGVGKGGKNQLQEDVILDDLGVLAQNSLDGTKNKDVQFIRGINFMNIAPTLVLFFLLWLWTDDLLIIVLTIPWAIIQGIIGFLFMFVKDDLEVE